MEEFFSPKLLLSLPGCVTIVVIATQILKNYIPTNSKIIALVISILVTIARIFTMDEYSVTLVIIEILNILPILWGSMSGYDTLLKNKQKPVTSSATSDTNSNDDIS